MAGQAVVLYDFNGNEITSSNPLYVTIGGTSETDPQYPLATDSDSVYVKDLNLTYCDNGDFSGSVSDYFDSLKTLNSNTTSDNPKIIKIWFERTVYAHEIGLGCDNLTKGFGTDVTVKLLGSGEAVRFTKNYTGLNPNSALLEFGPSAFNGIILEFNTASEVCLSNITIRKAVETTTTIQALKPDGNVTNIDATTGGNLKVSLEEVESQISTNSNTQIKTTLYGEDGQDLYIEQLTGGIPNINTDHALIHKGYGYSFSILLNTLAGSAVKEYCLTSPSDLFIHLKNFNIQVLGSSIKAEILVSPTVTVNTGAAVSISNLNHNSSLTAETTIKENPTYTGGTSARAIYALSDSTRQATGNADFNSNPNQEFITKDGNEQYILKITNLSSDDCLVSIDAFFYEETKGLVT